MILVATVQALVAEVHGVPLAAMREADTYGTRQHKHVHASQEAMYLSREMCARPGYSRQLSGASYTNLGRRFNRDHTTVISGVRAVARRIATDDVVRRRIDSVSVRLLIEGCATFVLVADTAPCAKVGR